MKFVIDGEPKGKARPRVTKSGITYTPKETMEYENWVRWSYREQCGVMLEGQIRAAIICYFSIPKSVSQKKREQMLQGKIRPQKKPDLDNIAKIILDSLNGLAYKDDSQVISLTIEKYYNEVPRVEVELWGDEECMI